MTKLSDSPGLKSYLSTILSACYQESRGLAADETGLELDQFPEQLPFSLDDILNIEFLPE
jgi:hypothetical protein